MRTWRITALACGMTMTASVAVAAEQPLCRLRGTDFAGGAGSVFGTVKHELSNVNYVYAESTGEHASMRAKFSVQVLPSEQQFVHIEARDDDAAAVCPIEILLNSKSIFTGPNGFPQDKWAWKHLLVPVGAIRLGENELVIANRAKEGALGMPPWFMVAAVVIAGEKFDPSLPVGIEEDFRVNLPEKLRPLPEPLPAGTKPGFKIRGTKGWMWTPEQYLAEIPVLKQYKMNFFMNCYGSMCDIEHYAWGDPNVNRWWEPLPAEKKQKYERVVRACQDAGIDFCFSMNPNLCSKRFVSLKSPADIDALYQHYAWMQSLGAKWFNVSLDDITAGIDAADQAGAVNEILYRLRAKDPSAQMIFCPTYYWATGDEPKAAAYLEKIGETLDKDVYCFWTGDGVVGQITRRAAETFRGHIKHRLIVWDNYPVNDHNPTLHLGPVIKRDADLCEAVDGIMGNPMCPQNEINRIPLLTLADYAWNPRGYDPARSIGQAILHLSDTPVQHEALRQLVELYPGMLLEGQGTGYNPVLTRFNAILAKPHMRFMADIYLSHAQDVARQLNDAFPDRFKDAGTTLAGDITKMQTAYQARYGRGK